MTDMVCVERADLLALWERAQEHAFERGHDDPAIDRVGDLLWPPPTLVEPLSADVLFEHFWTAYGRKMDRKAARKAWDRLTVDPNMVIEKAAEYRRFCLSPGSPNQKHAATWLNGECWADELEAWTEPSRQDRNRARLVTGTRTLSLAERLAALSGPHHPAIGG